MAEPAAASRPPPPLGVKTSFRAIVELTTVSVPGIVDAAAAQGRGVVGDRGVGELCRARRGGMTRRGRVADGSARCRPKLFDKVELSMLSVAPASLSMAPPFAAVLFEIVASLMVSVPRLSIAPPSVADPSEIVKP